MPTPLPDPAMASRLRRARKMASFDTAAEAWQSRIRGIREYETYSQHERGTRGFAHLVARYAAAYQVSEDWLRDGRGNPKGNIPRIPIVGEIGPLGVVADGAKVAEFLEFAEHPPVAGDTPLFAYRVTGDHNFPALFMDDIVYTGPPGAPEACVGKHCIATLADGTKRAGILARDAAQQTGVFLLVSLNASPLVAEVIEAALVVWIRRGG